MKKIKYILLFKHCLTKPKNLRGAAKQMVMKFCIGYGLQLYHRDSWFIIFCCRNIKTVFSNKKHQTKRFFNVKVKFIPEKS